jgi:UDP-N-acetylmuramoyl-L-alanyl-D-glutamate--2,6-diaminopimelate ligase
MKLRQLLATIPNIVQMPDHPALEAEVKGLSTNSHALDQGLVVVC